MMQRIQKVRIQNVLVRASRNLSTSIKAPQVNAKEFIKDVEDTSIAGLNLSSVYEGLKNNLVRSLKNSKEPSQDIHLGRFKVGVDNFAKGMQHLSSLQLINASYALSLVWCLGKAYDYDHSA